MLSCIAAWHDAAGTDFAAHASLTHDLVMWDVAFHSNHAGHDGDVNGVAHSCIRLLSPWQKNPPVGIEVEEDSQNM